MAIQGEPDAELEDMLGDIEAIQRASMKPIKAGAMGSEVYAAARSGARQIEVPQHTHFLGHGMGLVSHEAPRLTANARCPTRLRRPTARSKPAW